VKPLFSTGKRQQGNKTTAEDPRALLVSRAKLLFDARIRIKRRIEKRLGRRCGKRLGKRLGKK